MTLFYLLIALQLKHFIIDFPLQTRYQWANKGIYGHLGGVLHATLHALGTFPILFIVTDEALLSLYLALADGVIHYHVDWAKTKINAATGWTPTGHPEFWVLLGLDQFLHQLTYIGIIIALYFTL